MSNPIVCNRSPLAGTVAGVGASTRCSIRSATRVVLSGLNAYLGSGPAFYEGEVLPEELTNLTFVFRALSGTPNQPATRTIDIDGALKIEKLLAANQEAMYYFGGLEAPMVPEDPLMAEFKLKLNLADVVPDGAGFTGVMFGVMVNNKGFTVRFFTSGGTQWIEVFDAAYASTQRINFPALTYKANFDWKNAAYTYKVLWHPGINVMRLYVSSGMGDVETDTLLVDGQVNDFPTVPSGEQLENQPWAFFGHGYPTPKSTSYWYAAYLHNLVDAVVRGGVPCGGHEGFLKPDVVTKYLPTALPLDDELPWVPIPASFGTIEGSLMLRQGELSVSKRAGTSSVGFYRVEPRLAGAPTVFDFSLSGVVEPLLSGQASGIGVFLTDGTKMALVEFLVDDTTYYVGLLKDALAPQNLLSYEALETSWLTNRSYRLVYDPAGTVSLKSLTTLNGVLLESTIVALAFSDLPNLPAPGAGVLPSPALGLILDGNLSQSAAEAIVTRFRYSTNIRSWESSMPAAWTYSGPAPESSYIHMYGDELVIDGALATQHVKYTKTETIDHEDGLALEFRTKIDAYTTDGELNAPRSNTGVGITVDDGTYKLSLVFADEGPELGRIAYLATNNDWDANLISIRKREALTLNTYFQIDWSVYHMYRIERTPTGRLQVFVDDADVPMLDLEDDAFDYPAGSSSAVQFGVIQEDKHAVCRWTHVRYSAATGYELKAFPLMSENEILQRFNHAVNTVVEAEEV